MSKVKDFLAETGIFFLATVDGDQPKLRPLGAFLEEDGKLIFGVGDFKNVYRQMLANPLVEIAACKKDGHWLRYTGRAVFETDDKYAEEMIRQVFTIKDGIHVGTKQKFRLVRETPDPRQQMAAVPVKSADGRSF